MSDFAPGDLAMVVAADAECPDREIHSDDCLSVGAIYRVKDVAMCPGWNVSALVLWNAPVAKHPFWCVCGFRKIDKADEGFSTWMKALRPVKQPVRERVSQ